MKDLLARSPWLRASIGSFVMTVLFIVFYGAVPSALIAWTNVWSVLEDNPDIAPRIRDVGIVAYHGGIVGLTFFAFSLWQRLNPVNADADEAKREAGGYR